MSRLIIVIETKADPTLTDPHDIATNIIDNHNGWLYDHGNGDKRVEFVSAEWA